MTQPVTIYHDNRFAVVEINHPPVNTISQAIRAELLTFFTEVSGDTSVDCIFLKGANGCFVAGADIRELGKPPQAPALRDVVQAMLDCAKPIVAVMEQLAIGGGLELALASDVRLATANTAFSFPETKLGIIPGAGGTQLLPRLIGCVAAIDFSASAGKIDTQRALSLGLVDAEIQRPVLASAFQYISEHILVKSPLSLKDIPTETAADIDKAIAKARKKAKGSEAVARLIDVILQSANTNYTKGLAIETDTFLRLRDSKEAAALRYLFFAEREAPRLMGFTGKAKSCSSIGVVGSGTMGSGISAAIVAAGFDVMLVERDADVLALGLERIQTIQQQSIESGRISTREAEARMARISTSTDLAALSEADLIIEAIYEDMEVKKTLFKQLGDIAKPGAVLATNTSFLDVDEIARASGRVADVLGLHFFSPAHIMRLLEVVRGKNTSDQVLATGLTFAKQLGKLPVISAICDGFIGNRISQVYRNQCEFMLEEGAYPDQIDTALCEFGFAMGPFTVVDMAGLDISWARRKRLAVCRDDAVRYSPIADRLCEQGRFGQKTGAGWYRYEQSNRKRQSDVLVNELIESISVEKGFKRRSFNTDEIVRRALFAMVNEAALVVEEGIAQRASDIDVVLVNGYGFPRSKGGPLYWVSLHSDTEINAALDEVQQASGYGFRRAEHLLDIVAEYRIA